MSEAKQTVQGPRCPKCGSAELQLDWDAHQGFNVLCWTDGNQNWDHFWDALEIADFAQFFPLASLSAENARLRGRLEAIRVRATHCQPNSTTLKDIQNMAELALEEK